MENIAVVSKVELHRQGEKMEKMKDNLYSIDEELTVSNRTMDDIKRRRRLNTLIIYGVVALIALSVMLTVYFKVVS